MANFISCSSCGMTYLENAERRCPHCGTTEGRASGGFDLAAMRFDLDRIPLKKFIVLLVMAVLVAVVNFLFASHTSSSYAADKADLAQVKVIVESGQFEQVRMEFEAMKQKIENGYKFTDEQIAEFEEQEALMNQLPDNVYEAIAEAEDVMAYIDFRIVLYVVSGVVLIIAAILVALRFRVSFRVLIGASALGIALLIIMEVWGAIMGYKSIDPYFISAFAACGFAIIKECIDCDPLVFSSSTHEKASAPAVVGAAMPKVQELYSFEDMPELSGMKALDAELERQDAQDTDDVMDSVSPIGVENTTSEKPLFTPSEVAPEVEPVVPLTDHRAGDSITDEGENIAITPLERPMFEVDMMEDEAMPAISKDDVQPVPQPVPVQSAAPVTGIWFCSVCGSLNENTAVCDTCGATKK